MQLRWSSVLKLGLPSFPDAATYMVVVHGMGDEREIETALGVVSRVAGYPEAAPGSAAPTGRQRRRRQAVA